MPEASAFCGSRVTALHQREDTGLGRPSSGLRGHFSAPLCFWRVSLWPSPLSSVASDFSFLLLGEGDPRFGGID